MNDNELSTLLGGDPMKGRQQKKRNMPRRRLKIIIIAAVVFVAMLVCYFVFVAPGLGEKEPAATNETIYPILEQEDILSISVHNDNGEWGFSYDAETDDFYIDNSRGTPYNTSSLDSLLLAARDTIILKTLDADAEKLSDYGLGEDERTVYFDLTAKSGEIYRVYIGDKIVTGGGYYCLYEGDDNIYILDSSMSVFSKDITAFVTPMLSLPVSEKDYYMIPEFSIMKDGEVYLSIKYADEAQRAKTASTSEYEMIYPAQYVPSASNTPYILKKFIDFEGSEALVIGYNGEELSSEVLEQYGLYEPHYVLYYKYSDVENMVYISSQNEDGSYYAYSCVFNMIARVSAETLDFLNWDFIDYIDKPLFQRNINDISEISISSPTVNETFKIEGESTSLLVTPKSKGKAMDATELESFRQYYIKLLSLYINDYTESTSQDEWLMTMRVVTDKNYEYEYSFYAYSTRRCYFTVNGKGEFYVLRDTVEKILSDTVKLQNGQAVTAEQS